MKLPSSFALMSSRSVILTSIVVVDMAVRSRGSLQRGGNSKFNRGNEAYVTLFNVSPKRFFCLIQVMPLARPISMFGTLGPRAYAPVAVFSCRRALKPMTQVVWAVAG